jgi:hypothetical protein
VRRPGPAGSTGGGGTLGPRQLRSAGVRSNGAPAQGETLNEAQRAHFANGSPSCVGRPALAAGPLVSAARECAPDSACRAKYRPRRSRPGPAQPGPLAALGWCPAAAGLVDRRRRLWAACHHFGAGGRGGEGNGGRRGGGIGGWAPLSRLVRRLRKRRAREGSLAWPDPSHWDQARSHLHRLTPGRLCPCRGGDPPLARRWPLSRCGGGVARRAPIASRWPTIVAAALRLARMYTTSPVAPLDSDSGRRERNQAEQPRRAEQGRVLEGARGRPGPGPGTQAGWMEPECQWIRGARARAQAAGWSL